MPSEFDAAPAPTPEAGRSGENNLILRLVSRLHITIGKIFIAGSFILIAMMLLTVVDVVARYFFNKPVQGTWEITGLLLVCLAACALAYCQIQKGHIRVQLLTNRLPVKAQIGIDIIAYLFALFSAVLITWQTFERARVYMFAARGNLTETLGIPLFPFMIVLGLGFFCLALASLIDFVSSVVKVAKS